MEWIELRCGVTGELYLSHVLQRETFYRNPGDARIDGIGNTTRLAGLCPGCQKGWTYEFTPLTGLAPAITFRAGCKGSIHDRVWVVNGQKTRDPYRVRAAIRAAIPEARDDDWKTFRQDFAAVYSARKEKPLYGVYTSGEVPVNSSRFDFWHEVKRAAQRRAEVERYIREPWRGWVASQAQLGELGREVGLALAGWMLYQHEQAAAGALIAAAFLGGKRVPDGNPLTFQPVRFSLDDGGNILVEFEEVLRQVEDGWSVVRGQLTVTVPAELIPSEVRQRVRGVRLPPAEY